MTRGTYDYGLPVKSQSEYVEVDLNEVSSRLGGISQVNRSGNVVCNIWPHLLTSNFLWSSTLSAGIFRPSPKHQIYNRPSLKVDSDATISHEAGITSKSAPFDGSLIGVCAYTEIYSINETLYLELEIARDAVTYRTKCKIDLSNGNLSLWDNSGAWSAITWFRVPTGIGSALVLKYSFDLSTLKYGKLWFGSKAVYDISTTSFQSIAGAAPDQNTTRLYINNNLGVSNTIYITDVVITVNELV